MGSSSLSTTDTGLPGIQDIESAWHVGHHAYAGALVLVLAVALARRYLGPRWPFLHTDAGSAVLVLLGSFGGALVTALSGGTPLTPTIAETAAGVAVIAAGGYGMLKNLLVTPVLCRWEAQAGPRTKMLLRCVLWVFCHRTDGAPCAVPAPTATPSTPVAPAPPTAN
jgi:hypothetical protein